MNVYDLKVVLYGLIHPAVNTPIFFIYPNISIEGCRVLNISWCNKVVFYVVNNVHDMDRQYFGDESLPEYGTYSSNVV